MLTALRIQNFAIVKELELDFSNGLTAFTGETGAGKSIMIDALMLALGARAEVSVIRLGEDKCDITACFHVESDSFPAKWLIDNELPLEDGAVILRRVLYREGRFKSYINGQLFPLQKVKELSSMLVHIHGQHEHQTLLQHSTHREQLDRYAHHADLLEEVLRLYKSCHKIQQELEILQSKLKKTDRAQLLKFQVNELSLLNLQDNEMQMLHEEHQLLHHAREYLETTQQIKLLLNADDETNLCQTLSQILHRLQSLPQEQTAIKTSIELINNALIHCEEAYSEIKNFANQVQLDPVRLQVVEERMSILHQLARKHQVDANRLASHLALLEKELDDLQAASDQITKLQDLYNTKLKAYRLAANKLSLSRQLHAKKLAAEISLSIQQLGMPKGRIEIEFSPLEKIQPLGLDKVEYKVATNPGILPDNLAKIASGGELSRISLAIQVITAQRGSTPTLFFDEVDVGIGGATAARVGQLLRKLGERLQVFCVTHQPQVASSAHHHFIVEKQSDNYHTYSRIIALEEPDKVNEIARMLGGLSITEQTRSHAKELLRQSMQEA